MKKTLLVFLVFLSGMSVMADDVQKLDAATITRISFSGDNVILTFSDGTTSTVTDMSTVTIDFSNVTSIDDRVKLTQQLGLEGKPVYDLSGRLVSKSAATLKNGVYVIDGKKVTVK